MINRILPNAHIEMISREMNDEALVNKCKELASGILVKVNSLDLSEIDDDRIIYTKKYYDAFKEYYGLDSVEKIYIDNAKVVSTTQEILEDFERDGHSDKVVLLNSNLMKISNFAEAQFTEHGFILVAGNYYGGNIYDTITIDEEEKEPSHHTRNYEYDLAE
jgi:hypothetical protein